ncbi:MAG: YfhO family protein [Chloroflexi bacterium]|nr:YfhO family protein [Chloroflexota bacterium]
MARAAAARLDGPRPLTTWVQGLALEVSTLLLLAALPLLFFWRLFTPAAYDLASIVPGDFTDLHFPNRVFATRELLAGKLPLWNPYVSSGHSALGDIQVGIFYPLNTALSLWLGHDGTLSYVALEALVAIHLSLAAIFTYLLARRLIGSRMAAITSSLVFTYGSYLTSYPVQQVIILEVSVWLPLVLLLLDLGIGRRRLWYFVLAGVAACLAILAGHPQTFTYLGIAAGLFLLYRLRLGRRPFGKPLLGVVVFLGVTLGLPAIQLIPSYEHLALTARTDVGYEFVKSGFQLRDLVGLVFPTNAGGRPLYVGIVPLLLAGWALLRAETRSKTWFWLGLAVLGLVMSFGGNTFFHSVEYVLVPGLKFFRNHERTALIFSMAVAILAGYGVRDLLGRGLESEEHLYATFIRWARWLFLCLLAVSLVFYFGSATAAEAARARANELSDRASFAVLLLFLALVLLHLRLRFRWGAVSTGILLIALVGFDLFTTNWQNNLGLVPPDKVFPETQLVKLVQGGFGQYRVASEGLLPGDGNAGSVYGIQDVVGNSPLEFKRYRTFEKNVEEWQRWQLLNVRYILTKRQFKDGRFKQIGKMGDTYAYEIAEEQRLPRAMVVYQAQVAGSDQEAFDLIKKANLRQQVILARPSSLALPDKPPSTGFARVESYGSDRITVAASLPENGILVMSEVDYPGWRASVDGAPADIIPADYLLRAVPLSRGQHVVDFVYDPRSLAVGRQVSILTLIFAALVVLAEIAPRLTARFRSIAHRPLQGPFEAR